ASHGRFQVLPAHTRPSPTMTTTVLQTSVEKCNASASSASLWYFRATAVSARARVISIAKAKNKTTKAVRLGWMCTEWKKSREEVEPRMERFRKNTKTARTQDKEGLQAEQQQRRAHAEQGRALLFLDILAQSLGEGHA